MIELQKWLRTTKRILHTNRITLKRTTNRGSQSGQHNNDIQYKHKVIPAPSITEIKKRKETIITRFFIKNINHRYQKVNKLRADEQNNINNIISPIQGTKRIDINEKVNKNGKQYNYTQTTLTVQNDNLQHRDINTSNNKYCSMINHSNSHSLIQPTRQLIYFFSCDHKKK